MKSLKTLSDRKLLNQLSKLVKQELDLTLEILPHLIEVENRKIYLSLGYRSMFVYCTEGLGYPESSAWRRICAGRAIRECPRAYKELRRGSVNLGTLALVWRHLTPELLEEIQGKSYRQVQAIISRFNPLMKHRDKTRLVSVQKPVETAVLRQTARTCGGGSSGLSLDVGPDSSRHSERGSSLHDRHGLTLDVEHDSTPHVERDSSTDLKRGVSPILGDISLRRDGKKSTTDVRPVSSGPATSDETPTDPVTRVELETVKMHQVNCLIENAVMQMLDRCKALLSGKYPCGIDYNTLMMEMASDWLEKHDPVRRLARRERRERQKRRDKGEKGNEGNKADSPKTTRAPERINRKEITRHIRPATRDAVYNRNKGQCTFVGSTGKRCESRWNLEIHHENTPYAMGGDHSIHNLRLLCASHNMLDAERVYGRQHMARYIKQQE